MDWAMTDSIDFCELSEELTGTDSSKSRAGNQNKFENSSVLAYFGIEFLMAHMCQRLMYGFTRIIADDL